MSKTTKAKYVSFTMEDIPYIIHSQYSSLDCYIYTSVANMQRYNGGFDGPYMAFQSWFGLDQIPAASVKKSVDKLINEGLITLTKTEKGYLWKTTRNLKRGNTSN